MKRGYRYVTGGARQRRVLDLLARCARPLAAWWIAEQWGEDIRRVCRTLKRLLSRGLVVRTGTRRHYAWALA